MKLKRLNKEDIKIFRKYLNEEYEHSPYSLSGIFLWDNCIWDIYWAEYENYLLISEILKNSNTKRLFLPLPYKEVIPEKLIEIIKNTDNKMIYYVTEDYLNKYRKKIEELFSIEENQGYSDYVYLSEDLAFLKGSKFSAKRNLIYQFEKNYLTDIKVEKITKEKIDEIIEFSNMLFKRMQNDAMLECEIKAISNIKELYDEIEFLGICIYISGNLRGFALGSVLNKETCILNFEKADKNIKGLYQFLDREFARVVIKRFKYINKESDLGIESLKKSKISYHPIKIIKSFILKPLNI